MFFAVYFLNICSVSFNNLLTQKKVLDLYKVDLHLQINSGTAGWWLLILS
jgi:hypothetical protein